MAACRSKKKSASAADRSSNGVPLCFEAQFWQAADALRVSLASEPALATRAPETARALFYGAHGIAEHAASAAALDTEIDAFVRIHLRGARLPQPPA